jgi:VWFA-related protein
MAVRNRITQLQSQMPPVRPELRGAKHPPARSAHRTSRSSSLIIRALHARTRHRAVAAFALAALLAALPPQPRASAAPAHPAGRQQQQQQEPPPTIRVGVSLVNVYATVRDKNNRIVPDLTREDFRIFEDGQLQQIEYFSNEVQLPITLGLLIDTSVSQTRVLGEEQEAAVEFLGQLLQKKDLAFVASFDMNTDLLCDFTNDIAMLERALRRARINSPLPSGPIMRSGPIGTVFYDAIWVTAREKLSREVGRKALVILTDANDAGSRLKLEDALEAAQRSDVVIHIIGISDSGFPGAAAARKLAEQTGGRVIEVTDRNKLDAAFRQISEELRTQYTLGFYSANRARDASFRKLKVEVTRSGMKVLARRGYYAPGDPAK